jgi:hypothetical protein
MPDYNPTTGLAYGVISFNSLQPWCLDDLFYGQHAKDVSYEAAVTELVAEAEGEYEALTEECCISAAESGADREVGFDSEIFQQNWFGFKNQEPDKDAFVEEHVERRRDNIDISEPIIEGVYDGVNYRIDWLGGAPLLWVFAGPAGHANRACSPCVPGAADLDGGFYLEGEEMPTIGGMVACYCVPRSWLADEPT